MSHYLGLCASFKGKNDFSNFVSVQQLGTLIGRRRIATNLGMSIKYRADTCVEISTDVLYFLTNCFWSFFISP